MNVLDPVLRAPPLMNKDNTWKLYTPTASKTS